eukprot:3885776-Pyramimonas_sp.AAC.2
MEPSAGTSRWRASSRASWRPSTRASWKSPTYRPPCPVSSHAATMSADQVSSGRCASWPRSAGTMRSSAARCGAARRFS